MHNNIITKEDARRMLERDTGLLWADAEIKYLTTSDLSALAVQPTESNIVYFGQFVIESIDPFLSSVQLSNTLAEDGNYISLIIDCSGGNSIPSNVQNNIVFNTVDTFSDIAAHFAGWKFTQGQDWVTQSFLLTPGIGWNLSGGVYTHTSGTTAQAYSGAWVVSSSIRFTITFTGITAGSVTIGTDSTGAVQTITADGTYTINLTSDALDSALYITPSADFNGSYATSSVTIQKYTYA